MIRVVMFDLGMTHVDEHRRPFPHVEDALTAIAGFKTADGKALRSCLVSDFTMATPPVTAAKVTAIVNEYLAILDKTGLRPFFEPVSKRVTLSTQVGVEKPDRKIFETALQRLGAGVSLDECLFITEDGGHIDEARKTLKMTALHFRGGKSSEPSFDDWAEAAGLIARIVAPD
jgi:beta-phosphoglucomutase-like phosphatase (HAD superfamily)